MRKLILISLIMTVLVAGCGKGGNSETVTPAKETDNSKTAPVKEADNSTTAPAEKSGNAGSFDVNKFKGTLQASLNKQNNGVTIEVEELKKVPNTDFSYIEITFLRDGKKEGAQKFFTDGTYLVQDLLKIDTMASLGKEYELATAKPVNIDTKPFSLVMGNRKAKNVIIEITDFQCPYCKEASKYFKEKLNGRKDVALYIIHLPLGMHPNAETMAKVFEAGTLMGKNFASDLFAADYISKIEARIEDLKKKGTEVTEANFRAVAASINDEIIQEYANKSGNKKEFMRHYDSQAVKDKLTKSLEVVKEVGAGSTPTIIINGKVVSGFDRAAIDKLIDELK